MTALQRERKRAKQHGTKDYRCCGLNFPLFSILKSSVKTSVECNKDKNIFHSM